MNSLSSGVSVDDSRPSSIKSQSPALSAPTHETINGIKVKARPSKTNSIKLVLEKGQEAKERFKLKEVSIKAASSKSANVIDPDTAVKALKTKSKAAKRAKLKEAAFVSSLDGRGNVRHTSNDFVNEQEANQVVVEDARPSSNSSSFWRPVELKQEPVDTDTNQSHIVYELSSDDGFQAESTDASDLWRQVFDAVQEARVKNSLEPIAFNPLGQTGLQMLGLTHNALAYLLEQLPGAKNAEVYNFKHNRHQRAPEDKILKPNPSGCARTETFKGRSPLDMFSWLASQHRKVPHPNTFEKVKTDEVSLTSNRRATSLDLPMAMRFRHLAKNAKEAVGVYRSGIHGRGLYCKREIQAGEMVIEYAGEEIRAILTDKREKYYESRGIGCYMFKIDEDTVIDATMKGNAARFINHACDPSCYSKIVDILGKKHIIIFAMRKIKRGEELAYDYKFPIEDVKLVCTCGAKKCRKYMN